MSISVGRLNPRHYNAIINEGIEFFGAQGNFRTTLYEAAHMAFASAEGLLGRVKSHYGDSDPSDLALEKEQYTKLETLVARMKAVVIRLQADVVVFDEEAAIFDTTQRIQTAQDVHQVCDELQAAAKKIENGYLSGGIIFWYLPDYLASLNKLVDLQ